MPRGLDPRGAQLPISHNPLDRIISTTPQIKLPGLADLIAQWGQAFQLYGLQAIKDLTGLDLAGPSEFLASLGDIFAQAVAHLLGFTGTPPTAAELQAWIEAKWTDLEDAFANSAQGLMDLLTGITGATNTDVAAWMAGLLTGGSDLDASKLINLANIGAIAQGKITGLTADLGSLATSIGTKLAASTWQTFLDGVKGSGGGVIADVVNKLQHLDAAGGFDAAQLGNVTNIPAIAQAKITGLTTDLGNLATTIGQRLTTATWQTFLDGVKGSGGGAISDVTNKLQKLDATGGFDASALTNITNIPAIAQSKVTGLTAALSGLLSTSTWQTFLDGVKGSGGGAISDVTNKLQKLSATGIIDVTGVPNLSAAKITSGTFSDSLVPGLQTIQNAVGQAIDGGSGTYTPSQMLTALQSKTTNWVNGFVNGLTGQSNTAWSAADAGDQAANLAATLASQAVIINALQAASTGSSNSGMSGTDDFERVSPTNLGGSGYWNETYGNYSGSNTGYYAIANGHDARVVVDFAHAGLRWGRFRCTNPAIRKTQTLRQRVTRVTGSFIAENRGFIGYSEQPKSRLYVRVNDAETQYVFVEFADVPNSSFRKAQFGYKNGGAEVYVGSPVSMPADSPGTQTVVDAGSGSNDYLFTLTRNGQGVTSWDDTGHLSAAVNGSNNGWGHGIENFGVDSGSSYSPSSVAAISIADNAPAAVIGSGGRMYRTSTGTVNASSGRNLIGTSFYQSSAEVSSDITADLTNSRFTVSNAGFYVVNICYKINSFNTSGWKLAPVLYKNNTAYEVGHDASHAIYNSASSNSFPRWIKSTFTIQLAANDVVSPGYDASAANNNTFTGEASGRECYMTIALASRSLL